MAWQWEGDWQIETTLDGQPLDHDVSCIFFSLTISVFAHIEVSSEVSPSFYGKGPSSYHSVLHKQTCMQCRDKILAIKKFDYFHEKHLSKICPYISTDVCVLCT